MDEIRIPAAVCVIRVERLGRKDVLTTVRMNMDVSNSNKEWVSRTASLDLARQLVLSFLQECAPMG